MTHNEAMAKELLKKYPRLLNAEPPYTINLFEKRIKVVYYSLAGEIIKELRAEKLCRRHNAFSTDFDGNSYGVFIRDGLGMYCTFKCTLHEI